ncbi:AAA domain-containing protein [Aquitalea aquatica]|uniref:NERD domain-containing protein n=1 Tax=Aquitalea aquatica TaxID=3044273 RepID=A0A838Y3H5_9NEIS|nr:AAA domain-containing protein [Aquitalea magnusonii]MBA4709236.1 NERD domain-containing protein [Aquitalea magnusonii]
MDIVVRGNGLHKSETNALSLMQEHFSGVWFAYASVVLTDTQGSMEFDLIIITHDRVLVVELKEWSGRLNSYDGNWYINDKYRSKSPYDVKRNQALRLMNILKTEVAHKLGYYPSVEAHVVLCGSATPEYLPTSERRYVHTLQEFLTIREQEAYSRITVSQKFDFFKDKRRDRPTSPRCKQAFDDFFRGVRVQPADFKFMDYVASSHPDRVHGQQLFSEYPSSHKDQANRLAMMRRWDLAILGLKFRDDETWRKVVMREEHLYRTAVSTNSPLEQFLLRPIAPLVEEDINNDSIELYELRKNTRRLEEHINLYGAKWSTEQRLDLVRALLSPFAELHTMGIAHRDIDTQNLWYSADHNIILTSGYHAAFIPEKGTVKDLSEKLRSSDTLLPEDVYGSSGEVLSPFARDVYLLALVAHQICFHDVRLQREDGVYIWQEVENDPFDSKLDGFFERALDIEQQGRFENALVMLAEFNTITLGQALHYDDTQEVLQEITKGDFIKNDWSPFAMTQLFPAASGTQPNMFGEKIAYRCVFEGQEALFKFWQKAEVDPKSPGMNRRILRMRKRIEQTQVGELPLPSLLTYGMFSGGRGLFVVTQFEEGQGWSDFTQKLTDTKSRLNACIALCNVVQNLHGQQFAHGDLHPANILVKSSVGAENPCELALMLIDALDFGDSSDPYNVEYGPVNPTSTDSFGRDRFAVYKIVKELLGKEAPPSVVEELNRGEQQPHGVPVAIEPLRDSLKSLLGTYGSPEVETQEALVFTCQSFQFPQQEQLLQPEELPYYFEVEPSRKKPGMLFCRITGRDRLLSFDFDPNARAIENLGLRDASMTDYVSASNKAEFTFIRPVKVVRGLPTTKCSDHLIEFITSIDAVVSLLTPVEDEKTPSSFIDDIKGRIRPSAIWQAFLETEGEQRRRVEILSGEIQESEGGNLLIPCEVEEGELLELLGEEDEVGIYFEGESRSFGYVVTEESDADMLAVRVVAPGMRSIRQKLIPGAELIFESKRSHASRARRERAMNRVLIGESRINSLPGYFDCSSEPMLRAVAAKPDEAKIRDRYDSESERLNPRQIEAFQRAISEGPISVLQGPPGTGKTAFVSKFIHYLFENGLANNILLVGQSHTSVDTVAIKTRELCMHLSTPLSVVRLGHESAIDEKLLQCHSSSIQRQIRYKFQREYEKRINALASRLMLSQPLVEELAKLHRSIGPLLQRIRALANQQHESATKHYHDPSERETVAASFAEKIKECLEILERNLETRGYDFNLPSALDPDFWNTLSTLVARSHGVTNQLALQRLNHLIDISQDWIDVLASGGANYDKFLVKTSQLVCGTLVGIGAGGLHIDELEFDWVIVDEAGRAQASELMIALQCARRVLLVGDHKQLPPLYDTKHVRAVCRRLSIDEREATRTDFERAFLVNNGITFDTQYRMIEPIGDVVSHCFYQGALKSSRKKAADWYADLPYPLCTPVTWIDSGSGERAVMEDEPRKGVLLNQHELQVCLHLIKQLARPEHLEKLKAEKSDKHPYPVGIITMYSAQKRLLEEELSRAEWAAQIRNLIKIDTVDSYQGQENKIIILSLVRNNDHGLQGFLVSPSRINVALSRAQERLVIIGAQRMWRAANHSSALGDVLSYINDKHRAKFKSYEIVDGTSVIEGKSHA